MFSRQNFVLRSAKLCLVAVSCTSPSSSPQTLFFLPHPPLPLCGVWFTYPGILRDTWVSSRIPDPGPNTFTFSRSCKVVRHTARYLVVLSDSTQKTAHAKTFQSAREAAPSTQSSHIHRRHARQDLCRFNQPDTTPQPQVRRRRRRVRRRSTRTLRRARVRRRSVQRARLMP